MLPVIPSKNEPQVLQEMHMPLGNYNLLKIVNLLMEMEDGTGWAEIRQREESCELRGGVLYAFRIAPQWDQPPSVSGERLVLPEEGSETSSYSFLSR